MPWIRVGLSDLQTMEGMAAFVVLRQMDVLLDDVMTFFFHFMMA